jgi:hypothetical protein
MMIRTQHKGRNFARKIGHIVIHLVDDVQPDTYSASSPRRADGSRAGIFNFSGH